MCVNCMAVAGPLPGGMREALASALAAAERAVAGWRGRAAANRAGAGWPRRAAAMTAGDPDASVTLGPAGHRYRIENRWARLPPGLAFGDAAAVAVDSRDNVHVFCRARVPVLVFDRDGNFLRGWGEDAGFVNPHGAAIGPDDTLWLTDDGDHTVRRYTPEGRLLMTIGVPGRPAPAMSGDPFNRCTHTALSPQGEIYVSDGYSNARVHKYAPDGRLMFSWGEPGTLPGQFNTVHNICCDARGRVYVADRENHRVQVFDPEGRYLTQWNNLSRPCGMFLTGGARPLCYIGELGPGNVTGTMRNAPNLGPRVSILTLEGEVLAQLGSRPLGRDLPDQFVAPHGIAVDSRGDIYVAEVANTLWPMLFGRRAEPPLRCLRKLVRLEG